MELRIFALHNDTIHNFPVVLRKDVKTPAHIFQKSDGQKSTKFTSHSIRNTWVSLLIFHPATNAVLHEY